MLTFLLRSLFMSCLYLFFNADVLKITFRLKKKKNIQGTMKASLSVFFSLFIKKSSHLPFSQLFHFYAFLARGQTVRTEFMDIVKICLFAQS